MASNEYYIPTGAPGNNAFGDPGVIRAEFQAIGAAFDKLPVLTGNGDNIVKVNSSGDGLESVTPASFATTISAELLANKDASGGYAGLTGFKINFYNTAGTQLSFLENNNTAPRTYSFPDADGTVAMTTDIPSGGTYSNMLINGMFWLWRDTASVTIANGYLTADRWETRQSGISGNMGQGTHSVGFQGNFGNPAFYHRHTMTALPSGNGSFLLMRQKIEGVGLGNGVAVTWQFRARKVGNNARIAVSFDQFFGTGGSPSATVVGIGASKTNILTDTFTLYSGTVNLPSIEGKTIGSNGDDCLIMNIWMSAGSDFDAQTDTLGHQESQFRISQVGVTIGSTVVDYEGRTLAEERVFCSRYYQSGVRAGFSGNVQSGQSYTAFLGFPQMRKNPTVVATNTLAGSFPAAAGSITVSGPSSLRETRVASSTSSGAFFESSYTLDAEL